MTVGYRNNLVVMDIECYKNYFLVAFRDVNKPERVKQFTYPLDIEGVERVLRNATVVTFNGNHYDMPMLMYALTGASRAELKRASDHIIKGGLKSWEFYREYACPLKEYVDHIDLFELFKKGVALSLKQYAARLGAKKLQDLPIDPDKALTEEEKQIIAKYCNNDTANTVLMFEDRRKAIDVRIAVSNQYKDGTDFRSKSDAQMGETIIIKAVERLTGRPVPRVDPQQAAASVRPFHYESPRYISFNTPALQELHQTVCSVKYAVNRSTGHVVLPPEIEKADIRIGRSVYNLGIGGLHSQEKAQAVIADDAHFLIDVDVGSYYPSMIIAGGFYPAALGQAFQTVYKQMRDDRIRWKHEKGKETEVATYKIALNGTFGKLSSIYARVFAPKMLIQTTLTGQLSLLMLIERLEALGVSVVSANTDGIVIYGHRDKYQAVRDVITLWEVASGLEMEYTPYKAIYSQSVNSYLAFKEDGKVKRKGNFAERAFDVSGNGQVCINAAINYLRDGTPIRETVENWPHIVDYCYFQNVTGGAVKDGEFVGKVVRWYYSTETQTAIHYAKNGNTVPKSQGGKPCMELPDDKPADIDYDWYVRETYQMLRDLGANPDRDDDALVSSDGIYWRKEAGQKTAHLVEGSTNEALCGKKLKSIHDQWLDPDIGDRGCAKCKKVQGHA